jgi:propanol-preferring alcohol dehydrogenase
MNKQMTAFRMMEWGAEPRKEQVDIPSAGPGQVVIKVAGNGLCGSDPKMCKIPEAIGTAIQWQMPFTLGHEVGGWIEEIGAGVNGFSKGDPVVLVSSHSCGSCSYCLEGEDHNCVEGFFGRGYGRNGGLAPYVLVEHPREIIKLNKLDPREAGPLTDAGATSYHGVRRILPKLKPGSTAVVIGVGGLGSFAVQFIKAMSPARVIAVDNNPDRLAYAKELGADETLLSDEQSAAGLAALLGPEKAAAAMDFVGIDATIELGLGALRAGGAFVLVGSGGGSLNQQWYGALPKDGEVINYQGAPIQDTRAVIAMAEAGQIRCDVDIYPFSELETAFNALVAGKLTGRAVISLEGEY